MADATRRIAINCGGYVPGLNGVVVTFDRRSIDSLDAAGSVLGRGRARIGTFRARHVSKDGFAEFLGGDYSLLKSGRGDACLHVANDRNENARSKLRRDR